MKTKQMKFKSKKIEFAGLKFDSKKEFDRFQELLEMQEKGIISDLHRQVKFELLPKQKEFGERAIIYIADHVYMYAGLLIVEDVKSKITKKQPDYIIKRKLFKYFYCNDIKKAQEMFPNLEFDRVYFKEYE